MGADMQALVTALTEGDHKRAVALVRQMRSSGATPMDVVVDGIQPAMQALDNKCTVEQFNLLEIMLAGRAVSAVAMELFPESSELPQPKATVVLAALEGDIHDIGKHIVKMVLIGNRYHVVDCGKDASVDAVINVVESEGAQAVCISGLIPSIVPQVRSLRDRLAARGLQHVRVLAGGAALKQVSAPLLNVDFVGQTAFDAAYYLDGLLERQS